MLRWFLALAALVNVAADGPCRCAHGSVSCSGKTGLRAAFARCLRAQGELPTQVLIRNAAAANLELLTSQPTSYFAGLRHLDLRNNRLMSINGTALLQLAPQLQNLSLNGNLLNDFPQFPVGNRLTHLSLCNNQIATLNRSALETLTNLRSLELCNNDIVEVPSVFFPHNLEANSLIELNLGGNRIVSPCNLSALSSLQTLRLQRNEISELARECFARLPNLRTLDLSGNAIDTIEGLTFKSLSSLSTLVLRNNRIATLHDGAFFFQQFDSLERLELDFNEITSVEGKWLYSLGQLKILTLSNNRIARICDGAWDFTKQLLELDLRNNELQTLDADRFKGLVLLQRLRLSGNQIAVISRDAFAGLSALYSLDLSSNNLSLADEPIFSDLHSLRELNVSNNSITLLSAAKLSGVRNSLRTLSLYSNPIRIVALDTFRSLRYLDSLQLSSIEFVCDCSLLDFVGWYKQFAASNGSSSTSSSTSTSTSTRVDVLAQCGSPSALRGIDMFDLTVEQLRCDSITRPTLIREPESQVKAVRLQNLSLECVAQVSDDASQLHFGWLKDNEPVANSSSVRVEISRLTNPDEQDFPSNAFATRFRTVRSVLHFRQVDYTDAGTYQCVVQSGNEAAFSARSRRVTLLVYVAPQLSVLPQNAVAKLGDTAKLECAARGDPAATISWNKDGNRDFPAARERRIQFVDGDTALLIVDVAEADAGVYTCVASNLVGRVSANASLRILDAPPRFVEPLLRSVTVPRGASFLLHCAVDSVEQYELRWFFRPSDALHEKPRPLTGAAARQPTLTLPNVQQRDVGTYSCVATNAAGSRNQTAQLVLLSAPVQPSTLPDLPAALDRTADDSHTPDDDLHELSLSDSVSFAYDHVLVITICSCVVLTSAVWVLIFWIRARRTRLQRKATRNAAREVKQHNCTHTHLLAEQRAANFTPTESAEVMTKRSADSDYASSESHSNGEASPRGHIFVVSYRAAESQQANPPRSILHNVNRPCTLEYYKSHARSACDSPLHDRSPALSSTCFGCGTTMLQHPAIDVHDHVPSKRSTLQRVPPSETVLSNLIISRSPSSHNTSSVVSQSQAFPNAPVFEHLPGTHRTAPITQSQTCSEQHQHESHLRVLRASKSYCRIVDALTNSTEYEPPAAAAHERLVHFAPTVNSWHEHVRNPQTCADSCISPDGVEMSRSYDYGALPNPMTVSNRDSMCESMIWVQNDKRTARQMQVPLCDRQSTVDALETSVDC